MELCPPEPPKKLFVAGYKQLKCKNSQQTGSRRIGCRRTGHKPYIVGAMSWILAEHSIIFAVFSFLPGKNPKVVILYLHAHPPKNLKMHFHQSMWNIPSQALFNTHLCLLNYLRFFSILCIHRPVIADFTWMILTICQTKTCTIATD